MHGLHGVVLCVGKGPGSDSVLMPPQKKHGARLSNPPGVRHRSTAPMITDSHDTSIFDLSTSVDLARHPEIHRDSVQRPSKACAHVDQIV
jgi:hypothetical protein